MKHRSPDSSDPEVETRLRAAFAADDPEAAWYFDRGMDRVVRVAHGATDVPDLAVRDVEEDEDRYVEIPALTDGELHDWIARFVEEKDDAAVSAMLDERVGANARFLKRVASEPALHAEWNAFHAARVAEAVRAWRDGL